jgi:hypothetical protein
MERGDEALGRPTLLPSVIARLDRAIQYSEPSHFNVDATAYWITCWSLSSGGALRRPGGG